MAIIPSFFMSAVVALGIQSLDEKKHWIGTGFIVGRKEKDDPSFSTHYIITNKHVVKNQKQIFVRFNSLSDSFIKDYLVNLYDEDGKAEFTYHPDHKTDIIAIQIIPQTLINDKSIWGSFDLENHALTLKQMQETGVEEGCLVYSLGFPMNLVDDIKAPICRLGCISRVSDAFIKEGREKPTFLVDAQTFPGNSGGPIISRPEYISINGTPNNTNANLIGILSAYIPYRETLYSRQTGNARMIQEENSGLTIVHPVDRIKEVVELEWARIEEKKKENVKQIETASDTTRIIEEEVAV